MHAGLNQLQPEKLDEAMDVVHDSLLPAATEQQGSWV